MRLARFRLLWAIFLGAMFALAARGHAIGGGEADGHISGAVLPAAANAGPTSGPVIVSPTQSSIAPPQARVNVSRRKRQKYATRLGMAGALAAQWNSRDDQLPPADLLAGSNAFRTVRSGQRSLGLKEAILIAIKNNPAISADVLEPWAALQGVRANEGAFDPVLTSTLNASRQVLPTRFLFDTGGNPIISNRAYGWNLGLTKLLASSNGTLTVSFDNNYVSSNFIDQAINPIYTTGVSVSLVQPLLRNFGLNFATIHLRIAAANQAQARFTLNQQISDFVLRVGTDYWSVVRARDTLEVARGALALAQNLLHQNRDRARKGMLARLAVMEAASQVETANAQVTTGKDVFAQAQAVLWRDLGGAATDALPEDIEPVDTPGDNPILAGDAEQWLETAMQQRPELAAMGEAIRVNHLNVRYAKNQTLPELNLTAGAGLASVSGAVNCIHVSTALFPSNCVSNLTSPPRSGIAVPYQGVYGNALSGLGNFNFYNFAAGVTFLMPLDNETAQANLSLARIQYDQERMRYRDLANQIAVDVVNSLSSFRSSRDRARSTAAATEFASEALRAENARYQLGLADSHEVLQYQQELIAAQADQVNAGSDLEVAKLAVWHAAGSLLSSFHIDLVASDKHRTPWFARF